MKKIFEAVVGSQSYGTNVEGSDIDMKSVYMADMDDLLGFTYQKQIELNKDDTSYEVKRFLELLKSANPTVLELLYSPEECIQLSTPHFELIKANRDKFLTKKCQHSFGGYAVQQISKAKGLNKKMNWEGERLERKTILDFCYILGSAEEAIKLNSLSLDLTKWGLTKINNFPDCYAMYEVKVGGGIVGLNSQELRTSSIPKESTRKYVLRYDRSGYSQHCADYKSYQEWLKNRNTQRYVDIEGHRQKIDGKNMLHCRRLIDVALEIPVLKTIQVRRPNAEYLKSIRHGKVNLEEILAQAEEDIKKLKELYANSDLPDDVDEDFVNDLLIKIRKYG